MLIAVFGAAELLMITPGTLFICGVGTFMIARYNTATEEKKHR